MGEGLKIFLVFAVFGLATAEVKIKGEYSAGVFKVNYTWNIENPPHASKIQIMRNGEKITCKDTVNPQPGEVNCVCSTLNEKQGKCNITANAPENASDEVYVAISCLAETCTPEVAEVDVYAPATQVDRIKKNKKESGETEAECVFRGVPAPQITWKTIKNNELKETSGKSIKTTSTWNPTSKLWVTRSTFTTTTDQKNVMCFAQQTLKTGSHTAPMSDTVTVNAAGNFSNPSVYVALSLAFAFISKCI